MTDTIDNAKIDIKELEKKMEEMAKAPREEKPGTPTQG
jgi:hypothetical protein